MRSLSQWPSSRRLAIGITVWLLAIGGGMGVLVEHSFTAGAAASAPSSWPGESSLRRASDRHTLVFVAHPRCSCTRAGIAELSRLMTRLGDAASAYVLFVIPEGVGEDWKRSDLRERASIIDGVTVVDDPGGVEAARFGARTSGQVYLFDPDGRMRFAGGITPSRSHEGDNVGWRRIVSAVTTGEAERDRSDVFGCALEDEASKDFWLPGLRPASLLGVGE